MATRRKTKTPTQRQQAIRALMADGHFNGKNSNDIVFILHSLGVEWAEVSVILTEYAGRILEGKIARGMYSDAEERLRYYRMVCNKLRAY